MEFNPDNPVVKLCIQGMEMEENGKPDEAEQLFIQAWNESTEEFENFIVAYFIVRCQKNIGDRLKWLETDIQLALKINNNAVKPAIPFLHTEIAKCYEALGEADPSKMNHELARAFSDKPSDNGPFYHGTKADLQAGDLLTAGGRSNYNPEIVMNHIYFTALLHGAGLAASLAHGNGRERVYIVEPTGSFEHDPNVTNRKFPGNLTRSYRTRSPLKILGELDDWRRLSPEELKKWKEKTANSKGDIIN